MAFWIASSAGLVAAYFFGSIPTAFLVGKLFYSLDIREHGSKSVGATNALRVLGKWPALAVLLVDILKGVAAIAFVHWLFAQPFIELRLTIAEQASTPWAVGLAGIVVIFGHSRSVWLGFSGGKSVATGLGVVLAISWPVALAALAVFGVAIAIWRIVSVGSILAASSAIILICCLEQPLAYRLLVVAGGLFVVVRHRTNLMRLLAGTEPRLGPNLAR